MWGGRGRSRGEEEGGRETGVGEQQWCSYLSNLAEVGKVVVGWQMGKRRRRKKLENFETTMKMMMRRMRPD